MNPQYTKYGDAQRYEDIAALEKNVFSQNIVYHHKQNDKNGDVDQIFHDFLLIFKMWWYRQGEYFR